VNKSAAESGWVGAAVIVRNDKGQVMLLRRGETAPWMPGKWNLPGGTVDPGESPQDAAIRETKEEVAIDVPKVDHVEAVQYPDGVAHFFSAESFEGEPDMSWENDKMEWVDPEKVGDYDLVPGIEQAVSKVTGVPPRSPTMDAEGVFKEFLEKQYEGGKTKVPNPNRDTGHDEITVNYLLSKHPQSAQTAKIQREFQTWSKRRASYFEMGEEFLFGKYTSLPIDAVVMREESLKKTAMKKDACIIAGRRFGDSLCLIKNRDRAYDAELEIVHLEKKGVEMAVVLDTVTGYLEGVNEHGIAVVNTTLMVVRDEAEGKKQTPKGKDKKKPLTSKDGPKIYRALAHDNIEDAVESLRTDDGGIRGHTFVADGDKLFSIECSKNHPARVTELDADRVNTRTNHGVSYPDAGYTHGDDYVSSVIRRWEAQKRLQDIKRPETAAVALVDAIHEPDSAFNPVRVTDHMRTTSQLTIDTTNPRLLLYLIPGHAEVVRRRNLLPDGRKPKIPVRVFRYKNKMEEREADLGKEAMVSRVAARYKSKKKVKTKDGDEMTVYEYSDRQVADRNRKKAERVEKLRQQMKKLQTKVRKDVKSKDEKVRDLALAVGLMDETFERVGNDDSAKDGHFGVTTWRVKHVSFGRGGVTVSYVGKSGVDHKKKITNARIVSALKEACKDKKPNECVLSVTASEVNEYLKPLDITAKDIRGFHANREMKDQLRRVRKGKLPDDPKEKKDKLKDEFKKALEATAEAVGHEPSTLRSQYLVPGLEDDYMKDGTVNESHTKKGALRTAALMGTDVERHILGHAELAPVLVGRSRRWWLRHAPNLYRVARDHERPRPRIDGMHFDPDFFTILWYEDADGNRLPEVDEELTAPEGAEYMHSQFPHVLRHSVLRLNEDGTSTDVGAGESSYPEDLVNAMVRSGQWDVGDAIMAAAKSCERCLNVLCDYYGLDDGYPFDSEEYWKCGTRCDLCKHVDNSPEAQYRPEGVFWSSRLAAPTYDAYVKRKRSEGGPVMSREQWEAKVLGRGGEEPAEREPPSREEWNETRDSMKERHGLDKFYTAYRPDDRHLSVDLISVDESRRGEGNASSAMQETLDWADSNGVTVTLTPTSEFGSSKKRLEKWYRGMGFVPNKGRNKDFRFQDAMIRVPQSKTATKSDAEVEEEAVQKMLRKEPKKKPPRYDLRDNRTLDEDDDEDLGGGDDGDRDLSMKWNKVASRVAFRWSVVNVRPERVAALHLAETPQQPPKQQDGGDSQPKPQPKSGPSFDEWVKNQKFKHPETGNDVGFTSLPPEEQAKIREKWKGQQQQEEGGGKQKGQEEDQKERTTEDVHVDLQQARDEMRDIEAQMRDLTDEIKDLGTKIKQQRDQYLPHMQEGPGKQKIVDSMNEMQREMGRKQDELDDKKEEHADAKSRVDELKRERKDPGFAKAKREKKLEEQRAKRVQRAVSRAQQSMQDLLGKGSELPKGLGDQIGAALNDLDDAQVEAFSVDFQDNLQKLKELDPKSEEAIDTAARAAKFGDLHGLTEPSELAERLAQLSYAQNVVGNPMNVGGTPVGVTEMNNDKYAERARAAYDQFARLPSSMRRGAADKVRRALEGLDPETHRAQELNAILTGMDIAQIAATGDSLPGRPQPSKGMAALVRQMAKDGKVDALFKTSEDFFAEQARAKMQEGLEDMSPDQLGDLVTGGDPSHGYADLIGMMKDESTPDAMREMMMDFLIQDVLNDQWGDRAVRDTMQAAGLEDADDPDVRAEVISEAKQRGKSRMEEALGARERIEQARSNGEEPDPEDVEAAANYFDAEKGTGLREQAKALLDTIKDKFKKVVISPASAVLNHFVQTGERGVLEQETTPHPDEKAKEPRPREEREKAQGEAATGPKTPHERMVQRVRLKAERSKLKSQRDKVKDESKAKYDEKLKALDEQIGKLSEPAEGDGDREKPKPEEGDKGNEPEKDDESKDDEEHGPGDVWETEQGNWRAKNEKGSAKSFKSREEAEQYAGKGEKAKEPEKAKAKPSRGGEAPGEEFSGELGDFEETGPTKFAADRVAEVWLKQAQSQRIASDWFAHVRSFHPDDPKRPIVVLDAA
jgi:mutator protein MutT